MRYWKDNEHWMIRDGESDPVYDPMPYGCESCGWLDEGGVAESDLLWQPPPHCGWLCMECDG
jgi:hypothetical protein